MTKRTIVYTLCCDRTRDKAAPSIWDACASSLSLEETGLVVEGLPVMAHVNPHGDRFLFMRTQDVLSHDYRRYLPVLEPLFEVAAMIGIVNWHEGGGAQEAILTAHSTAEVPSGHFGPVDSRLLRGTLFALEEARMALGLDRFTTWTEASHWSGTPFRQPPELVDQIPIPVFDIEIGSAPLSWSDPQAARTVAQALPSVFRCAESAGESVPLLCLGGIHFESSFREAVLGAGRPYGFAPGHILPNQWLVDGGYDDEDAVDKLRTAAHSITPPLAGIVFHDNLKGPIKALARLLGEELGLPAVKHQRLRDPENLLREIKASKGFQGTA